MKLITSIEEIQAVKGRVLLDFFTPYCVPCKALAPHLEELEKAHGDITFLKVDAASSRPIAQNYRVMSVPTILLLEDGELINRRTSPDHSKLEDFLLGD